MAKPVEKTCK